LYTESIITIQYSPFVLLFCFIVFILIILVVTVVDYFIFTIQLDCFEEDITTTDFIKIN